MATIYNDHVEFLRACPHFLQLKALSALSPPSTFEESGIPLGWKEAAVG
jgi:hypothetical protein